jgi:pyruvate,water dikinase
MTDIIWFKDCSYGNKTLVGGKCSSLGELYRLSKQLKFNIADGFAITTKLYDDFINNNKLIDLIEKYVNTINITNITELDLTSDYLKTLILSSEFSSEQIEVITENYQKLCELYDMNDVDVAVRSSAIAEDLPNASFAGQQDTFLNIRSIDDLMLSVKQCFASLFNSRAISYRISLNIHFNDIKISVAIQKMVRSDIGSAGVGFSIDPETGYDKAIVINSSYGLGELVVSGGVNPDEFILDKRVLKHVDVNDIIIDPIITKHLGDKNTKIIYNDDNYHDYENYYNYDGTKEKKSTKEIETNDYEKTTFSLTDKEAIMLSKHILALQEEYSKMFDTKIGLDVEWGLDGNDNEIYILQSRPETIHSNNKKLQLHKYILTEKSELLVTGVSVGEKISSGKVKILNSMSEYKLFNKGDILVTDMTTPDWEPIMKISSGIITNKGGRTCHAAIVARELGLNAVVGTGNSTVLLQNIDTVTISCAEGEKGHIYNGILNYKIEKIDVSDELKLPVKLMLNVGNPESSFHNSLIPNSGVGLARLEFIISNYVKVHPLALYNYPNVNEKVKDQIKQIINETDSKMYFIETLARGISKIASAFYPNDVIVRLSDFKSNEYKNLIGGEMYEPNEENPMIGWRGASRYYSPEYEHAFELECSAIKYAREGMMMDNVIVMIPFCRTPQECKLVLEKMSQYGLTRGNNGLQVYIMCEIPSNVIEADLFSPLVDGVSIGGNDLLQLTLGVDRDSEKIAYLSSDENVSYRRMISMAIKTYKSHGVKIGFCGQQPSDSIDFCNFLINENIDSISVTPDSAISTIKNLGI